MKRSFKQFVEKELGGVAHFLIYAMLEWILIIIFFINGFIVFFANEFSRFFELNTPCFQCTRTVFMLRNPNFCNDSICEDHKREFSSLAFCHAHKKLSNIKNMCERCLLSFATEKESNCEIYKSLVGILHKDIEMFFDDDHQEKKDESFTQQAWKSSEHFCSCCAVPLKAIYIKGMEAGFLSSTPILSSKSSVSSSKNDENINMSLSSLKHSKPKLGDKDLEMSQGHDNEPTPTILSKQDEEDKSLNVIIKGNKFFGIPLTDSATSSPKWSLKYYEGDYNDSSMFHQWKRQVKLDEKSLIELYMELDEEISASSIAANNAMAMITQLQTDKATLQMERCSTRGW